MKKDYERLVGLAEIVQIYLHSIQAKPEMALPASPPGQQDLLVQHKYGWKSFHRVESDDWPHSQFISAYEMAFRLVDTSQGNDEAPVVMGTVEAVMVAEYRIPKGEQFKDEVLEKFCQYNGMVNVWPYWRELASSMANRMAWPDVTLPLLVFDRGVVNCILKDDGVVDSPVLEAQPK